MDRRNIEDSGMLKFLIGCSDAILLAFSMTTTYHVLNLVSPDTTGEINIWSIITIALLCYIPLFMLLPPILLARVVRSDRIVERVIYLTVLHTIVLVFILTMLPLQIVSRTLPAYFFLMFTTLLVAERLLFRFWIKKYRSKGNNQRRVIFVGNSPDLITLYKFIKNKTYGYHVLGVFSDDPSAYPAEMPRLGDINSTFLYLKEHPEVTDLYCAFQKTGQSVFIEMYRYCENNMIHFYALPIYVSYLKRRMVLSEIDGVIMLSPRPEPLSELGNRLIKRIFDVLVSLTFLLTLFPLIYVFVAIIIKIQSPGPVLFRQKRNGLWGKEFMCIKFRSMHVNKDADTKQATEHDPRKFRFGDLMRRTNIDELPQFINVLLGDMSMVGPRPHMVMHTEEYSHLINKYMVRHWVKPGITGWAQVQGFRGETKELQQMENRVAADIWYVENWTMWLDLRIMWKTVWNTIARKDKNAY
ncbi:MAG: undecaprenyl-phosphate glucose phosphotransferase [Clostridium sp.]|nr:undecaprenyl-phosphate glucose phosphotransferase [Clostridium sp.]